MTERELRDLGQSTQYWIWYVLCYRRETSESQKFWEDFNTKRHNIIWLRSHISLCRLLEKTARSFVETKTPKKEIIKVFKAIMRDDETTWRLETLKEQQPIFDAIDDQA